MISMRGTWLGSRQDSSKIADSADARRVGPEEAVHLEPGLQDLGPQGVQRRDPNFDGRQMVWDLPMIRNRLSLGAFGSGLLGHAKHRCLGVSVEL